MIESIKNPSMILRNPSNGIPALLPAQLPVCAPTKPSISHQFRSGIHQWPNEDRSFTMPRVNPYQPRFPLFGRMGQTAAPWDELANVSEATLANLGSKTDLSPK